MTTTIEQARAALAEYHAEISAGGEPHYPQWAADVLKLAAITMVFIDGKTLDDNTENTAQAEIAQIDRHLDAVLRASGSALKYFSMQKTLDDMRGAMRSAVGSTAAEQSSDVRNAALERAAERCDSHAFNQRIVRNLERGATAEYLASEIRNLKSANTAQGKP